MDYQVARVNHVGVIIFGRTCIHVNIEAIGVVRDELVKVCRHTA